MADGRPVELSVIVATYNRGPILRHVLESLARQTAQPESFEVVVADDGSTDATPDVVAEARPGLPNLTYLRLAHRGASAARNDAVRASRGRYLLFIDSDIIAAPGLVEEHLRFHRLYPGSVVTGPAVLVRRLEEIPRPVRPWHWSTAPFAGGNASASREAVLRAGLFDESFDELGWEDVELGIRLKRLGLRPRFNPRAVGYHYKPQPVDPGAVEAYAASQGRMAVRFVQKHPILEVRMATGLNAVGFLIDALASVGDWDLRLARWVLGHTDPAGHGWLRTVAAKQLYNRTYYKAAREALARARRARGAREAGREAPS